jgi:hypothetical protein
MDVELLNFVLKKFSNSTSIPLQNGKYHDVDDGAMDVGKYYMY